MRLAALAREAGRRVGLIETRRHPLGLCPTAARAYVTSEGDNVEEIETINTLFVEAREEIEYAKEDADTVYFNDSAASARGLVDAVVARWALVLEKSPDAERGRLQRSMGLKIEQLKAECAQLEAMHAD